MKEFKIRTLRADEIECRVARITSEGFQLLLYKDARVDMNILDEMFGSMWQRDHKEIKGNLYCGIGIWDDDTAQWVWKWDCGVESFSEKEKGEASDSFKRAGFNVGIGRELYTAPFIWIKGNVSKTERGKLEPIFYRMRVTRIEYRDNNGKKEIAGLEIMGDNEVIFSTYPKTAPKTTSKATKGNVTKTKDLLEDLSKVDENNDTSTDPAVMPALAEAQECRTPKGARIGDLTYPQLKIVANNQNYDKYIRACAQVVIDAFVRDDNGEILF